MLLVLTLVVALVIPATGCGEELELTPEMEEFIDEQLADLKGEQGVQGEQGEQGTQGIQGEAGEQGLQGVAGAKGTAGAKGATGSTGVTGEQGIAGTPGASGAPGSTGAQGIQGIKGNAGISAPMLRLVQKNGAWDIMNSEIGGLLQYTPEGREFGYVFTGFGLTPDTGYSLIYYADFEDKLVNWGGNNPGALIANGTSNSIGGLYLIGSVDLGMNLPSEPDANIDTYGYSGSPDYYPNAHGAKIWLVPSDCLTDETNLPVAVWSPNRFLFETDLIYYIDTDLMP